MLLIHIRMSWVALARCAAMMSRQFMCVPPPSFSVMHLTYYALPMPHLQVGFLVGSLG